MKDISRANESATTKTAGHLFVKTKVNSKTIGKGNGRNIRIPLIVTKRSSEFKNWLLQTPIFKRLIVIFHVNTNIFELTFNKNLNCASKALADGDSFKLLMSLKNARSNLIDNHKRLGKGYGVEDFMKATSDWIKLLKRLEEGHWDAISERVKNSPSKLNSLSAAIEDINNPMIEMSDFQRNLVSISTVFVDAIARAALSGSDDNKYENSNLNDAVYRSLDEAKSNQEYYSTIINGLKEAVGKM